MVSIEILNVSEIQPKLKHPTIFKHFDELIAGEGFVIDNDHDPKPLYYQLLGERGAIFSWEYLEEGPNRWKVRIAKNELAQPGASVGEIAASDIRKAAILKARGIEFSCGGNKSLKDASLAAGVNPDDLQTALNEPQKLSLPASLNFNNWSIGFLSDFILNTHHKYVTEQSEVLLGLSDKVAQRHGMEYPGLIRLAQGLKHFLHALKLHLHKEAEIIHPAASKQKSEKHASLQESVLLLQREHVIMVEDLNYFKKLTDNYTLPDNACNSFTYLYEKLEEFTEDVLHAIHLESNILYPKILNKEKDPSA